MIPSIFYISNFSFFKNFFLYLSPTPHTSVIVHTQLVSGRTPMGYTIIENVQNTICTPGCIQFKSKH